MNEKEIRESERLECAKRFCNYCGNGEGRIESSPGCMQCDGYKAILGIGKFGQLSNKS